MTPSPSVEKSGTVIETSKIVYGALLFSWIFVAFLSTALIALDGATLGAVFIAVPIIGILFSATGFLRPKKIQLNGETLTYRPIWGRSLLLRRADIASFDILIVDHRGSGFLICKMQPDASNRGCRHNLGYLLLPDELIGTLRQWLARTP